MANAQQREVLDHYLGLFNRLDTEGAIDLIDPLICDTVEFSDPFTHIKGRLALKQYLQHFISQVSTPRFEISHRAWDEDVCLVRWQFSGKLSGKRLWQFPGVSELRFAEDGRLLEHVDYWDSGKYFYRQLPVVGWLIRRIESRLQPTER